VRERLAFRLAVVRVLPLGGWLVGAGALLQLVAGLMPVAFIVTTSAVVGRVPAAVDAGLDSPEWRALRNMLILAGVLFVAQPVIGPLQLTTGWMLAWRVDDHLRQRAAAASFGPIGVGAIEESETFDTLADLSDPQRGTGFTPGLRAGARCSSSAATSSGRWRPSSSASSTPRGLQCFSRWAR
jgi:ATP-binding cassette subfamily B protein